MGTAGMKLFLYQRLKKAGVWLKRIAVKFWNTLRLHLTEYVILLVIAVYGMIYFSYGVRITIMASAICMCIMNGLMN